MKNLTRTLLHDWWQESCKTSWRSWCVKLGGYCRLCKLDPLMLDEVCRWDGKLGIADMRSAFPDIKIE
eukprot:5531907-Amphidinium_carterae.1